MNIFRRLKALEIVLDALIGELVDKGTTTRESIQKKILEDKE